MISKLSHVSFFVLDVYRAKDFYVNKLGFEIKMNVPVGDNGLWLTVSPKGQDIEITLIPVNNELMFKKDTSEKLAELIKARAFGYGVFETNDVYATYHELKNKGVEFIKKPSEGGGKPEAMFRDDSGKFFWTVPGSQWLKPINMVKQSISREDAEMLYNEVVETIPGETVKGDTVPYTSLNGHMYSYLSKEGVLALRLPKDIIAGFLEKYKTTLMAAYGIVQKEYAVVPDILLRNTKELEAYFGKSYEYVKSLKPKPTTKKK